jgi:hypothetical protein
VISSEEFIFTSATLRVNESDIFVSFNIISFFNKVPNADILHILSWHFDEDNITPFHHILTTSFFHFNGQFNEQMDGVAMTVTGDCYLLHVGP